MENPDALGYPQAAAASKVAWHRLHGLSPEVKASIDGGVIHDHRV